MPQLMLKGKMVVKDVSVALPEILFCFVFCCFVGGFLWVLVFVFFLFLDLVPEEPTKTIIVCVDLYSLDLDSFLFLTLRHVAITQVMASRH